MPTVTAAVLKYGTANWELQLMKARGIDLRHGFQLVINEVNSPNAASVALQAKAADVTVQDWLWVLKQRDQGRQFRFVPFSTAAARLMVRPDSSVRRLADLPAANFGVAGGATDKGWRLLQVLLERRIGVEDARRMTPRYGAPPLLNQLALRGDLEAVLSYWHYAVRLEAQGFTELASVESVLAALGVSGPVPMLGWTFTEHWVTSDAQRVKAFLAASQTTKALMREAKPADWVLLKPWMRASSDAEFTRLQEGFIAGIPGPMNAQQLAAVARVAELYRGVPTGSLQLDPVLFSAEPRHSD